MSSPSKNISSDSDKNLARESDKSFTISVQQLGKKFNREWIFRNFSHSFHSGEVYAVTGPNGSGKSTLMQILWGQMPPSTGVINYKVSGAELLQEDFYKYITVATPYLDLIDEFTLEEQLRFHFKLKPCRYKMTEVEIMERMYLAHARDKQLSNFSSGMKQRVKLALAFFSKADVIFLDEPGTNLDNTAFDWYTRELQALPSECLVFIASNQPSEYPANAQKIDIMSLK
ncbi:MAG TPA: ATP-binding cassette domain-containing protein [Chryseolinea sp.]